MTSRHVLIVLENLPLERDARVKRECRSLLRSGYRVTVVCPAGADTNPVPGVEVLTYPAPPEAKSVAGYLVEYGWSLIAAAFLCFRLRLRAPVDVVQACNPPDILWLIGLPMKAAGAKFVFDHHDLSPELWHARSGKSTGVLSSMLFAMERLSIRVADHVIATNESVKDVATGRANKDASQVSVVRNGPELSRLVLPDARPELKGKFRYLCAWLGVIGIDDGVEDALRAIAYLVHESGRRDCRFVFIGDGERLQAARDVATQLGLDEYVLFTGWLDQETAFEYLSTADLALAPDPPGPRSEHATMMKVMEYMAAGLPIAAFDVKETRVSAGPAAIYSSPGFEAYAGVIEQLLEDEDRRAAMAQLGRRRVREGLSWDAQATTYTAIYDRLCNQ